MSGEKNAEMLTTMPDGLISFRSEDERIHAQVVNDCWKIATADSLGELVPTQEDYRLHIVAPLEQEDGADAILDMRLQISKEDYMTFRRPHMPETKSAEAEPEKEPDALDVFTELDEEPNAVDDFMSDLRNSLEQRRIREKSAHEQRMAIVLKAANWLTDSNFLDGLIDSYGHKSSEQRDGVALTAEDIGQWIHVTDRYARRSEWGFFMTYARSASYKGDDSWHYIRHRSLLTGEEIQSDQPEFKDKVSEDLKFISDAIQKVVDGYNSKMEEHEYFLTSYGTVPRIGLTAYNNFYTGYTELAPVGRTLLSASLEEAYYGILKEDERTGTVSVQTVYKDSEKAQPLIESVYAPFGSSESTFMAYTADTSGFPTESGLREHTYKGMYGENKKPKGFAPAHFYATIKYIHDLAKSAPTE